MIIKTIVPKQGNVNSYINKPVVDRLNTEEGSIYNFEEKIIGIITSAVELENGYELTMSLFEKTNPYEVLRESFVNGEVCSVSIERKNDKK